MHRASFVVVGMLRLPPSAGAEIPQPHRTFPHRGLPTHLLRWNTKCHTPMADEAKQFDYPVGLNDSHRAIETPDYGTSDKFECPSGAYTHTGAWPAFDYCPFCGAEL